MLQVYKTAMQIIIEDEGCEIIDTASLLLGCLRDQVLEKLNAKAADLGAPLRLSQHPDLVERLSRAHNISISADGSLKLADDDWIAGKFGKFGKFGSNAKPNLANRPKPQPKPKPKSPAFRSSAKIVTQASKNNNNINNNTAAAAPTLVGSQQESPKRQYLSDIARIICDDVIRDSIANCREPDYKMELAKLLSGESKIELYIEQGKLNNAQMLACAMNRPDYVLSIFKEAAKLNQDHVKTVCQLWLAKHETLTRNFIR